MKCRLAFLLGSLSLGSALAAPLPPDAAPAPPAAVNPFLDAGGSRLATSDTQAAIRSLTDAVRAEPNNVLACRLLAIALLHVRQHERAADTAENCLKHASLTAPQRAATALLLGQAEYGAFLDDYEKGRFQGGTLPDMAQLLSQMATHNFPTSRGDVIVTQGDVNAQDDFDAARSTFRDTVARLQQRLAQADAAFKDALAADPHLAGVHDGLGLVRASQGFLGEARHEFQAEIFQHGPSGSVYLHLANLDAAERHTDDAIEDLRLAIRLAPESAAPYLALAPLYDKAHDQERARWAKGLSQLRQGNLTGAERTLDFSGPRTTEMLCGQAQLCLVQKRSGDARALLRKAQAVEPRNAEVAAMLGDLEEADSHDDTAIALYHQALECDAACGAAWYGLGLVYDRQKDRESALADYAQALQINPNNALAKLNFAADEADLGRQGKALADLQDYEDRFPTACNLYVVETAIQQLKTK